MFRRVIGYRTDLALIQFNHSFIINMHKAAEKIQKHNKNSAQNNTQKQKT